MYSRLLLPLFFGVFTAVFLNVQPAAAYCCNIFTTQDCAGCNFFTCHCTGKCDCQNSCDYNCNSNFNTCLIYNNNPIVLKTCSAMFSACERRCKKSKPTTTTAALATPKPEPKMSLVQDLSDNTPHCIDIFRDFDADGDAAISKTEFVDLMTKTHTLMAEGDAVLDADSDGIVTGAEIAANGTTYEAIFSNLTAATHSVIGRNRDKDPIVLFSELDTDQDGQIGWQEAGLPTAP